MVVGGALVLVLLASCSTEHSTLLYGWDGRGIVCSVGIDDYRKPLNWRRIEKLFAAAAARSSVVMMHAHELGASVAVESLERIMRLGERYGLEYVTYDELSTASPRAGFAIAFDDRMIGNWHAQRELFQRHDARMTFFVNDLVFSNEEHAMLANLAADGHAIEAHSLHHFHAPEFVAAHGEAAYLAGEAVPSIMGLRALGYPITTYAYPYGEGVPTVDQALLSVVDRVRINARSCPR